MSTKDETRKPGYVSYTEPEMVQFPNSLGSLAILTHLLLHGKPRMQFLLSLIPRGIFHEETPVDHCCPAWRCLTPKQQILSLKIIAFHLTQESWTLWSDLCVFVYVCVCMFVCMSLCLIVHVCLPAHVFHVCMLMHFCVCVFANMRLCVHVHTSVSIWTCVHVCLLSVFVYTCVCYLYVCVLLWVWLCVC